MSAEAPTLLVDRSGVAPTIRAPEFSAEIIEGPDRGTVAGAVNGRLAIGTADGAELRLTDRTVSRFHAELEADEHGIVLRDLGSTNGTWLGETRVREVVLRTGGEIRLGQSRARLRLGQGHAEVPTSGAARFGGLIGGSPAMRRIYLVLERAAPTTAPVLITGESGTGKELAARAIHDASARCDAPFEVVDCGSLPPTLVEAELFGHERGAFTHALHARQGAFERAHGGTLFLDELGELPLEVQPKLLRVLGEHQIRPIGSSETRSVDVRIVAATNRDLRREVNAGRFRADLYYRLAVLQIELPPLRARLDDLPLLVRTLLERIALERAIEVHVEPDASLLSALGRHHWPGNVRELRSYLEQLLILRMAPDLAPAHEREDEGAAPSARADQGATRAAAHAPTHDDPLLGGLEALPLRAAKTELLERFERRYLERLLEATGGNVAEAARRAGVDRGTLFRTIRRYRLALDR